MTKMIITEFSSNALTVQSVSQTFEVYLDNIDRSKRPESV